MMESDSENYRKLNIAFLTLAISMLVVVGGLNALAILAVEKARLMVDFFLEEKEAPSLIVVVFGYCDSSFTQLLMGILPGVCIFILIKQKDSPQVWFGTVGLIGFLVLHTVSIISAVFPWLFKAINTADSGF